MTRPGPKMTVTMAEARDRQAALYGLLAKKPVVVWTMEEILDRLRRIATPKQVESAIYILTRQGLIHRIARGPHGASTFRASAP